MGVRVRGEGAQTSAETAPARLLGRVATTLKAAWGSGSADGRVGKRTGGRPPVPHDYPVV